MTDSKTALIELRDKVRAGDVGYWPSKDYHLATGGKTYHPPSGNALLVDGAYHGSIDAAKALHEAVLPGWVAELKVGADGNPSRSILRPLTPMSGNPSSVSEWAGTPARAWLLAILEALIAQEDTPQ